MIPAAKLKEYMELNVIQIAPLAFYARTYTERCRGDIGRSSEYHDTANQKMFLTRMGMNTKNDCYGRYDANRFAVIAKLRD